MDTFYYCALDENSKTCPKQNICKRYTHKNGVPASVSNTAGTFVCNHVMYGILYMIDKKYPNIKGGFIHVPYIPSQVVCKPNTPSMAASDITKGLELCIKGK